MEVHQAAGNTEPADAAAGAAALRKDAVSAAIRAGYLDDEHLVAAIVDTQGVRRTIESLHRAFPPHFRHAFAAKANPMSNALRLVREAGMECEAASRGELRQAFKAGFDAAQIIYDEPAKTQTVLRQVLESGAGLNIDNFQELGIVASMMNGCASNSRIGFRINPQVGSGTIGAMSTATKTSKFGVALDDGKNREKVVASYGKHRWLTSIHCHVGSQGCPLELMAAGVRKLVGLAEEINAAAGFRQIEVIDIGGGLPVNFESDDVKPTYDEYAQLLRAEVPQLFSGNYIVKTEFGRSIYAKSGFVVARIEYTKNSGGRQIAVSHAGVQTATRTVFMPDHWKLRISVFDAAGNEKTNDPTVQDIAGPCCFAGDMIATERRLPRIEPGDHVVLHDTGAYYFSSPYFFNSLPSLAVYGAEYNSAGGVDFDVWRKQQTVDDMMATIG